MSQGYVAIVSAKLDPASFNAVNNQLNSLHGNANIGVTLNGLSAAQSQIQSAVQSGVAGGVSGVATSIQQAIAQGASKGSDQAGKALSTTLQGQVSGALSSGVKEGMQAVPTKEVKSLSSDLEKSVSQAITSGATDGVKEVTTVVGKAVERGVDKGLGKKTVARISRTVKQSVESGVKASESAIEKSVATSVTKGAKRASRVMAESVSYPKAPTLNIPVPSTPDQTAGAAMTRAAKRVGSAAVGADLEKMIGAYEKAITTPVQPNARGIVSKAEQQRAREANAAFAGAVASVEDFDRVGREFSATLNKLPQVTRFMLNDALKRAEEAAGRKFDARQSNAAAVKATTDSVKPISRTGQIFGTFDEATGTFAPPVYSGDKGQIAQAINIIREAQTILSGVDNPEVFNALEKQLTSLGGLATSVKRLSKVSPQQLRQFELYQNAKQLAAKNEGQPGIGIDTNNQIYTPIQQYKMGGTDLRQKTTKYGTPLYYPDGSPKMEIYNPKTGEEAKELRRATTVTQGRISNNALTRVLADYPRDTVISMDVGAFNEGDTAAILKNLGENGYQANGRTYRPFLSSSSQMQNAVTYMVDDAFRSEIGKRLQLLDPEAAYARGMQANKFLAYNGQGALTPTEQWVAPGGGKVINDPREILVTKTPKTTISVDRYTEAGTTQGENGTTFVPGSGVTKVGGGKTVEIKYGDGINLVSPEVAAAAGYDVFQNRGAGNKALAVKSDYLGAMADIIFGAGTSTSMDRAALKSLFYGQPELTANEAEETARKANSVRSFNATGKAGEPSGMVPVEAVRKYVEAQYPGMAPGTYDFTQMPVTDIGNISLLSRGLINPDLTITEKGSKLMKLPIGSTYVPDVSLYPNGVPSIADFSMVKMIMNDSTMKTLGVTEGADIGESKFSPKAIADYVNRFIEAGELQGSRNGNDYTTRGNLSWATWALLGEGNNYPKGYIKDIVNEALAEIEAAYSNPEAYKRVLGISDESIAGQVINNNPQIISTPFYRQKLNDAVFGKATQLPDGTWASTPGILDRMKSGQIPSNKILQRYVAPSMSGLLGHMYGLPLEAVSGMLGDQAIFGQALGLPAGEMFQAWRNPEQNKFLGYTGSLEQELFAQYFPNELLNQVGVRSRYMVKTGGGDFDGDILHALIVARNRAQEVAQTVRSTADLTEAAVQSGSAGLKGITPETQGIAIARTGTAQKLLGEATGRVRNLQALQPFLDPAVYDQAWNVYETMRTLTVDYGKHGAIVDDSLVTMSVFENLLTNLGNNAEMLNQFTALFGSEKFEKFSNTVAAFNNPNATDVEKGKAIRDAQFMIESEHKISKWDRLRQQVKNGKVLSGDTSGLVTDDANNYVMGLVEEREARLKELASATNSTSVPANLERKTGGLTKSGKRSKISRSFDKPIAEIGKDYRINPPKDSALFNEIQRQSNAPISNSAVTYTIDAYGNVRIFTVNRDNAGKQVSKIVKTFAPNGELTTTTMTGSQMIAAPNTPVSIGPIRPGDRRRTFRTKEYSGLFEGEPMEAGAALATRDLLNKWLTPQTIGGTIANTAPASYGVKYFPQVTDFAVSEYTPIGANGFRGEPIRIDDPQLQRTFGQYILSLMSNPDSGAVIAPYKYSIDTPGFWTNSRDENGKLISSTVATFNGEEIRSNIGRASSYNTEGTITLPMNARGGSVQGIEYKGLYTTDTDNASVFVQNAMQGKVKNNGSVEYSLDNVVSYLTSSLQNTNNALASIIGILNGNKQPGVREQLYEGIKNELLSREINPDELAAVLGRNDPTEKLSTIMKLAGLDPSYMGLSDVSTAIIKGVVTNAQNISSAMMAKANVSGEVTGISGNFSALGGTYDQLALDYPELMDEILAQSDALLGVVKSFNELNYEQKQFRTPETMGTTAKNVRLPNDQRATFEERLREDNKTRKLNAPVQTEQVDTFVAGSLGMLNDALNGGLRPDVVKSALDFLTRVANEEGSKGSRTLTGMTAEQALTNIVPLLEQVYGPNITGNQQPPTVNATPSNGPSAYNPYAVNDTVYNSPTAYNPYTIGDAVYNNVMMGGTGEVGGVIGVGATSTTGGVAPWADPNDSKPTRKMGFGADNSTYEQDLKAWEEREAQRKQAYLDKSNNIRITDPDSYINMIEKMRMTARALMDLSVDSTFMDTQRANQYVRAEMGAEANADVYASRMRDPATREQEIRNAEERKKADREADRREKESRRSTEERRKEEIRQSAEDEKVRRQAERQADADERANEEKRRNDVDNEKDRRAAQRKAIDEENRDTATKKEKNDVETREARRKRKVERDAEMDDLNGKKTRQQMEDLGVARKELERDIREADRNKNGADIERNYGEESKLRRNGENAAYVDQMRNDERARGLEVDAQTERAKVTREATRNAIEAENVNPETRQRKVDVAASEQRVTNEANRVAEMQDMANAESRQQMIDVKKARTELQMDANEQMRQDKEFTEKRMNDMAEESKIRRNAENMGYVDQMKNDTRALGLEFEAQKIRTEMSREATRAAIVEENADATTRQRKIDVAASEQRVNNAANRLAEMADMEEKATRQEMIDNRKAKANLEFDARAQMRADGEFMQKRMNDMVEESKLQSEANRTARMQDLQGPVRDQIKELGVQEEKLKTESSAQAYKETFQENKGMLVQDQFLRQGVMSEAMLAGIDGKLYETMSQNGVSSAQMGAAAKGIEGIYQAGYKAAKLMEDPKLYRAYGQGVGVDKMASTIGTGMEKARIILDGVTGFEKNTKSYLSRGSAATDAGSYFASMGYQPGAKSGSSIGGSFLSLGNVIDAYYNSVTGMNATQGMKVATNYQNMIGGQITDKAAMQQASRFFDSYNNITNAIQEGNQFLMGGGWGNTFRQSPQELNKKIGQFTQRQYADWMMSGHSGMGVDNANKVGEEINKKIAQNKADELWMTSQMVATDKMTRSQKMSRAVTSGVAQKFGFDQTVGAAGSFVKSMASQAAGLLSFHAISAGIEGVGQMVQYMTEYNAQLRQYKKLEPDWNSKDMRSYTDSLKDVAFQYGKTMPEIAEASMLITRSGYSAYEGNAGYIEGANKALTEQAVLLATVADEEMEVGDAGDSIISALKGYAVADEDVVSYADHYVDMVNAISNNAAVVSNDITTNLGKTASVAANAGMDVDETVAMMATMASVNRSASRSATALKTLSTRWGLVGTGATIGQRIEDAAAGMGVEVYKENGERKTIDEAFGELSQAYMSDQVDQSAKDLFLYRMGGATQSAMVANILTNWDDYERLKLIGQTAGGSADRSAQALVTPMMQLKSAASNFATNVTGQKTLMGALGNVANIANAVSAPAGKAFTPYLASVIGAQILKKPGRAFLNTLQGEADFTRSTAAFTGEEKADYATLMKRKATQGYLSDEDNRKLDAYEQKAQKTGITDQEYAAWKKIQDQQQNRGRRKLQYEEQEQPDGTKKLVAKGYADNEEKALTSQEIWDQVDSALVDQYEEAKSSIEKKVQEMGLNTYKQAKEQAMAQGLSEQEANDLAMSYTAEQQAAYEAEQKSLIQTEHNGRTYNYDELEKKAKGILERRNKAQEQQTKATEEETKKTKESTDTSEKKAQAEEEKTKTTQDSTKQEEQQQEQQQQEEQKTKGIKGAIAAAKEKVTETAKGIFGKEETTEQETETSEQKTEATEQPNQNEDDTSGLQGAVDAGLGAVQDALGLNSEEESETAEENADTANENADTAEDNSESADKQKKASEQNEETADQQKDNIDEDADMRQKAAEDALESEEGLKSQIAKFLAGDSLDESGLGAKVGAIGDFVNQFKDNALFGVAAGLYSELWDTMNENADAVKVATNAAKEKLVEAENQQTSIRKLQLLQQQGIVELSDAEIQNLTQQAEDNIKEAQKNVFTTQYGKNTKARSIAGGANGEDELTLDIFGKEFVIPIQGQANAVVASRLEADQGYREASYFDETIAPQIEKIQELQQQVAAFGNGNYIKEVDEQGNVTYKNYRRGKGALDDTSNLSWKTYRDQVNPNLSYEDYIAQVNSGAITNAAITAAYKAQNTSGIWDYVESFDADAIQQKSDELATQTQELMNNFTDEVKAVQEYINPDAETFEEICAAIEEVDPDVAEGFKAMADVLNITDDKSYKAAQVAQKQMQTAEELQADAVTAFQSMDTMSQSVQAWGSTVYDTFDDSNGLSWTNMSQMSQLFGDQEDFLQNMAILNGKWSPEGVENTADLKSEVLRDMLSSKLLTNLGGEGGEAQGASTVKEIQEYGLESTYKDMWMQQLGYTEEEAGQLWQAVLEKAALVAGYPTVEEFLNSNNGSTTTTETTTENKPTTTVETTTDTNGVQTTTYTTTSAALYNGTNVEGQTNWDIEQQDWGETNAEAANASNEAAQGSADAAQASADAAQASADAAQASADAAQSNSESDKNSPSEITANAGKGNIMPDLQLPGSTTGTTSNGPIYNSDGTVTVGGATFTPYKEYDFGGKTYIHDENGNTIEVIKGSTGQPIEEQNWDYKTTPKTTYSEEDQGNKYVPNQFIDANHPRTWDVEKQGWGYRNPSNNTSTQTTYSEENQGNNYIPNQFTDENHQNTWNTEEQNWSYKRPTSNKTINSNLSDMIKKGILPDNRKYTSRPEDYNLPGVNPEYTFQLPEDTEKTTETQTTPKGTYTAAGEQPSKRQPVKSVPNRSGLIAEQTQNAANYYQEKGFTDMTVTLGNKNIVGSIAEDEYGSIYTSDQYKAGDEGIMFRYLGQNGKIVNGTRTWPTEIQGDDTNLSHFTNVIGSTQGDLYSIGVYGTGEQRLAGYNGTLISDGKQIGWNIEDQGNNYQTPKPIQEQRQRNEALKQQYETEAAIIREAKEIAANQPESWLDKAIRWATTNDAEYTPIEQQTAMLPGGVGATSFTPPVSPATEQPNKQNQNTNAQPFENAKNSASDSGFNLFDLLFPKASAAETLNPYESETSAYWSQSLPDQRAIEKLKEAGDNLNNAFDNGANTATDLDTSSDNLDTSFNNGKETSKTLDDSSRELNKDKTLNVDTKVDTTGIDKNLEGGKVEYKAQVDKKDLKDSIKGGTIKYKAEVEKPKLPDLKAQTAKVQVDDEATPAINNINSKSLPDKQVNITAVDGASGILDSIISKLAGITSKTVTVTTNYVNTGDGPHAARGGIIGSGSLTGERHADGGVTGKNGLVGTWLGDEYNGSGEKKPELVVTPDGNAHLAGLNGWEYENLPKGTRVYSNSETKNLLGNSYNIGTAGERHYAGGLVGVRHEGGTSGTNYPLPSQQKLKDLYGDNSTTAHRQTNTSTSTTKDSGSSSRSGGSSGSGSSGGSGGTSSGVSNAVSTEEAIEGYVKDIGEQLKDLLEKYNTMISVVSDQAKLYELEIEKSGEVPQAMFDLENRQLEILNQEKTALEGKGATIENSKDYRAVIQSIQDLSNTIFEQQVTNMQHEIDKATIKRERLERDMEKYGNPALYYETFEAALMEEQEAYDNIRSALIGEGYSEFSDKVKEIDDKIEASQDAVMKKWNTVLDRIVEIYEDQKERNDTYMDYTMWLADKKKEEIEENVELIQQEYDDETKLIQEQDKLIKRAKRLQDAEANLADAQKKRVMVMTDTGWQWEENPEAVRNAQKTLDDVKQEIADETRDDERAKSLEDRIANEWEKYYGEGSEGKKAYATQESIYAKAKNIEEFQDEQNHMQASMLTEIQYGTKELEALLNALTSADEQARITSENQDEIFSSLVKQLGVDVTKSVIRLEDGTIDKQNSILKIITEIGWDKMDALQKSIMSQLFYMGNNGKQTVEGFAKIVTAINSGEGYEELIDAIDVGWNGDRFKYGNIDLSNRQIYDNGDGTYSTVLGGYSTFGEEGNETDIAYTLFKQTKDGVPVKFEDKEVEEYIKWLIDENGGKIDENIFALDRIGNGIMDNMLAAMGQESEWVADHMHEIGAYFDASGKNQYYNNYIAEKSQGTLENIEGLVEDINISTTSNVQATEEVNKTTEGTEQAINEKSVSQEKIDAQNKLIRDNLHNRIYSNIDRTILGGNTLTVTQNITSTAANAEDVAKAVQVGMTNAFKGIGINATQTGKAYAAANPGSNAHKFGY